MYLISRLYNDERPNRQYRRRIELNFAPRRRISAERAGTW